MKENKLLLKIRDGESLTAREKIVLTVSLSLPAILANITSILMEYIDASMVGHISAKAGASIGLVASTTWLFGAVTCSFVAGFSIQVAHAFGAKDYAKARALLWQALFVVIGIALCSGSLGFLIADKLPSWLGGSSEIASDASWYFRIYACALPIMALRRLGSSMLQCSGNMKVPGILNSMACILDIILNFFCIFPSREVTILASANQQANSLLAKGNMVGILLTKDIPSGIQICVPGLGLGVAGAALGTALTEVIIAIALLIFLLGKTPQLHFQKEEKYGFRAADIKKALTLSLPIAFEQMVVCGGMVVTTSIVAPLGVISIAANSFAVTAESLCYMPGYGIQEAATTLIGQSVGAGRKELARSFGKLVITMGMGLMAIMGVLMFFASPVMMGLLTSDVAVIALGVQILKIEAFAEAFYGAAIVCNGVFRGAGDTLAPSIMNLVSLWAVRIPLSYLLVGKYALIGVWIAMAVELTFRGCIFLLRFITKRWMRKL